MVFYSTNRRLDDAAPTAGVSLRDALFAGIAPDGGLYLPERWPSLSPALLRTFAARSYADIACEVLRPFAAHTFNDKTLRRICDDAYDFEVPLEPADPGVWILRLDRGPTASFKDFAARWMARAMQALRPDSRPMTVLVATSGDTGGAVGDAFHGLDDIRVFLLYPAREISSIQKRQMDAIGGNVQTLSIDGTFDHCQAMVKQAFLDPDLARLNLTSANSINVGRILPQSVYYAYAWSRVAPDGGPVTFCVPSGNLGNSFGCEAARRMGLPVARLILAVNENDEVPRWLAEGTYRPVSPSRNCLSNAMNVGNPSNLARFFEVFGGTVTREGTVRTEPRLDEMRRTIASVSVSDADTRATIRDVYRRLGIVLEPHGAVGYAALGRVPRGPEPAVCLETAHPAKFPETIEEELGVHPELPEALRRRLERGGAALDLAADYAALKEYLLRHEVG